MHVFLTSCISKKCWQGLDKCIRNSNSSEFAIYWGKIISLATGNISLAVSADQIIFLVLLFNIGFPSWNEWDKPNDEGGSTILYGKSIKILASSKNPRVF